MNSENGSQIEPMELVDSVTLTLDIHHVSSSFESMNICAESTPDDALVSSEIVTHTSPDSLCTNESVYTRLENRPVEGVVAFDEVSLRSHLTGKYLCLREPITEHEPVCSVPHCESGYCSTLKRNKINNVRNPTLFPVPKDPVTFTEWERAIFCARENTEGTRNSISYVCEYHFEERFIERYERILLPDGTCCLEPKTTIRLKENAVPTKCRVTRPPKLPLTEPRSIGHYSHILNAETGKVREKLKEITTLPVVDCYDSDDDFTIVKFESTDVREAVSETREFSFEILSNESFKRPYWSKVVTPETNNICYQYWRNVLPSGMPSTMVRVTPDLSVEIIFGAISSLWVNYEKISDFSKLEQIFVLIEQTKPCMGVFQIRPCHLCKGYLKANRESNHCYRCHSCNKKLLDTKESIHSLRRKIGTLRKRQKTVLQLLRSSLLNVHKNAKQMSKGRPIDEVLEEMRKERKIIDKTIGKVLKENTYFTKWQILSNKNIENGT